MKFVSINAHTIRANALRNKNDPPIRIAKSKNDAKPLYAHEIEIVGPARYDPQKRILRCGARLVLECADVVITK